MFADAVCVSNKLAAPSPRLAALRQTIRAAELPVLAVQTHSRRTLPLLFIVTEVGNRSMPERLDGVEDP
jgi:hypothetical protein